MECLLQIFSNQKFDLFSYEGTEILNKYINVVKYGGYL